MLEGVTLGRQVQLVVQVLVDLTGVSVFSQQSSQDSQSSHPDDLGGHTSVSGTLSLTVTHVSTVTLGLSMSSSSGSRVDGDRLLDDGTVTVQLSDGQTRVSSGQLGGLVRVQPDLSLTNANDAGCKSLLSSKISPEFVSRCSKKREIFCAFTSNPLFTVKRKKFPKQLVTFHLHDNLFVLIKSYFPPPQKHSRSTPLMSTLREVALPNQIEYLVDKVRTFVLVSR